MGPYQVFQIIALGSNLTPPKLYMENFRILPVRSYEAWGYQILHVALSSGLLPRVPWGQIWPHPGGHKFYIGLYRENFINLPVPSHKA